MAKILPIFKEGASILRTVCKPIGEITDEIKELADNMELTMLIENALGLAANQVGRDLRIITIATDSFVGVMINPILTELSVDTVYFKEGCLSIPNTQLSTGVRHKSVKVEYLDVNGRSHQTFFNNMTAVVLQHEIDHLNGILFTDYDKEKNEKIL